MLKNEREIKCLSCDKIFILRDEEYEWLNMQKKRISSYCKFCRKKHFEEMKNNRQNKKNETRQIQLVAEHEQFEKLFKTKKVVNREQILKQTRQVLYILGNGFDLMHGVRSSYYDFQKTLGRRSDLRICLETYLKADDLWSDFEAALGHMNVSAMSDAAVLDMWLDMFDAYDEDASAASFTMAYEAAADPARTISYEMKKRFRRWIESLELQTQDRPLKMLFDNQKVLCFNYTEFVETLYGVEPDHICYIHGCRCMRHGKKEDLILGHIQGSGLEYDESDDKYIKRLSTQKQYVLESAQNLALYQIADYDQDITKYCDRIIKNNKAFFQSIQDITDVIVIGHSLAEVDWDYFREIILQNKSPQSLQWYFGCYGLKDLLAVDKLVTALNMNEKNVHIFRTDDISVQIQASNDKCKSDINLPKTKLLCKSEDTRWIVRECDGELTIHDRMNDANLFLRIFTMRIHFAYFLLDAAYLLLVSKGGDKGVFLLRRQGDAWEYVSELQGIPNQGVMNPRIQKVLYTTDELIFVYRSRVRTYSLPDGGLVQNIPKRNAGNYSYEGTELSEILKDYYHQRR